MVFTTMELLRRSVHLYSMRESFPMHVKRSDRRRFEATCANAATHGCTFIIKARGVQIDGPAWIREIGGKHYCHDIDAADAKTACGRSRVFIDALRKFLAEHPKTSMLSLQDALSKECGVNVPEDDIRRGIRIIRRENAKASEPLNFRVLASTATITALEQEQLPEADDFGAC